MHVFGSGEPANDCAQPPFESGSAGRACSTFSPDEKRKKKRTRKSAATVEGETQRPAQDPFDRIVALCAVRDRARNELEERLMRDGYASNDVQEALSRAVDCGLVDDIRFADALIRGRVRAGKGEVTIRRDLEAYGIAVDDLAGWPDEYGLSHEEQVQRALSALYAQPPRAKDAYQAAFRKLTSRGYPKAVVTKAVRRWHEGSEHERGL